MMKNYAIYDTATGVVLGTRFVDDGLVSRCLLDGEGALEMPDMLAPGQYVIVDGQLQQVEG